MARSIRNIVMLMVGIAVLTEAGVAWAHKGEARPPDAATAVRQALAFLDAVPPNFGEAAEKAKWAVEAQDQTGVDRMALEQAGYGLVLLGGLLALAVLFPPGLGPTPVEGVEVTKPPLPLLWLYPLENWFGLGAIFYASLMLFLFLALVPFLDRGPERLPLQRRAIVAAGSLVLAVILGLIALALLGPTAAHVGM